ncbi:MAG: hypothetical protein V1792_01315 [Pseudomonadota bacterium]
MLNIDEQVNLLMRLTDICRVTEHGPGRVTLKVGLTDLGGLSSLVREVDDLEGEIARIPGYKSYRTRVGLTGGSVVIDYDPAVFPPDLWDDLGGLRNRPSAGGHVAQRLRNLLDGNTA